MVQVGDAGQGGLPVLSQSAMTEIGLGRFLYLAVFAVFLAGCVPMGRVPSRDEFGVSTVGPAGSKGETVDGKLAARLDTKVRQICSRGYTKIGQDIEPAEANRRFVDMKLRCAHYDRLDFDYSHIDWTSLL